MSKVLDGYNIIVGSIVALGTALFGVYWYLFAGFLLCNVLDWLTGWYKARVLKIETSKAGLEGIVRKLGYWIIILISFLLPKMFMSIGKEMFGIELDFMAMLGWFTLATLLVNEIRSILENLVESGYEVPTVLIKGLAVTEKLIQSKQDDNVEDQNQK